MAPSSGNLQNWKFIVVLDEDRRKAVAEACLEQYWMQNAPVHIVIVSEIQKARQFYGVRGERLYAVQNCAAAAENMLLAAHDQGLGACWVGSFDEEQLRRACGIPEYIRPQAVVALGYADEKVPTPSKYRLYDIVHLEKWDAKIKDVKWVLKEHAWSVEDKLLREKKLLGRKAGKLKQKIKETTQTILQGLKKHMK
jgi:nitroreductase